MAGTCSLAYMLMILQVVHCTVNPPQDLTIIDPGHLGLLEIHWSPSQEHIWMKEQDQCLVQYELHYYDIHSSSWESIRTSQTSYKAQFDLGQEVKVCVYTVVSGRCVEGHKVKSKNCTELVQKPDRAGVEGVQDLTCVYYNMEHMVCRWKRSSKMPAQTQEALHYWHRGLPHAKECPRYIISEGLRSGCNFSGTQLPTFSDINLCVNASSAVRALYSSLQIQNIVKPKATGEVRVEAGVDGQLKVFWDSPPGRIPPHCLQWEVQDTRESRGGEQTRQQVASTETAVTLALPPDEATCLSVRSMLNQYCAKSGLWSDWSPPVCYPEKKLLAPEPRRDMLPEYMFITVIVSAALLLGLSVWAAVTLRRSSQEKTKAPSFCCLFDKNSEQFIQVVQHVK